jgi:hypothetical protein
LRFCGRIFQRQELQLIGEIARDYVGLAVTEMARTICELLPWKRPNGRLKDQQCRQMLEYLRDQGWLKLPSVRNSGPRGPRQIELSEASAPQARVEGSAGEFEPLVFEIVEDRKTGRLWTEPICVIWYASDKVEDLCSPACRGPHPLGRWRHAINGSAGTRSNECAICN